ncbi:hypothetical protein C5S30_01990, partial [ANME-1 cluster archaeon GoMg4]|nr:hypothetical protein [ANME-1 cluster archaeon GoMg4]
MGKRKIAAIDPGHRTAKICAETIDADIYDFKFRERHTYLGLIEAALKVFVIPKYDIYFLGTIHAMFFIF